MELVEAGDVADFVPGTIRGIDHGSLKFIVVNVDGALFALEGICTHAYAELSLGFLAVDRVICPLHLSQFDVRTGEPISPPAEVPLKRFPVLVRDSRVYIALDPLPP